jgi:hypothetical protein
MLIHDNDEAHPARVEHICEHLIRTPRLSGLVAANAVA